MARLGVLLLFSLVQVWRSVIEIETETDVCVCKSSVCSLSGELNSNGVVVDFTTNTPVKENSHIRRAQIVSECAANQTHDPRII